MNDLIIRYVWMNKNQWEAREKRKKEERGDKEERKRKKKDGKEKKEISTDLIKIYVRVHQVFLSLFPLLFPSFFLFLSFLYLKKRERERRRERERNSPA